MATITKTSNSTWSGTLGWTGGAPADNQDAVVDSGAGTGSFSAGATVSLSSLWIQPSASSPLIVASNSFSTVLFTRVTPPSPGNHTLYVAANKSMTLGLQLAFQNTYSSTHSVYIDSGGTLYANCIAGGTANTNTIRKYGSGTWFTASNEYTGTSSSNIGAWELYEGTLATGSSVTVQALGTASIGFYGGTLQVRYSRTFNNTITVNSGGGTITTDAAVVATMGNAAGGSGTLTIAGAGNVAWNNNISCSLHVTGLLTLGSTYNLSGSTLIGNGTIATAGSTTTISSNAPSFTGAVTGTFNYSGGTRATARTFGGIVSGTSSVVNVPAGTITFTNANTGCLGTINDADVTLNNSSFTGFSGGVGFGYVILRGNGSTSIRAVLRINGPSVSIPNQALVPRNNAHFYLSGGANFTNPAMLANGADPATPSPYIISDDTQTNTFNVPFVPGTGTAGSPQINSFICRTGGTLVVGNSFYANAPVSFGDTAAGSAEYNFNTVTPQPLGTPDPNTGDWAGTIRWTGTCLTPTGGNTATLKVGRGTLQINRTTPTGLANGLTIQNGATLHCATPTAAYAAQLSGNLTLNAGSTMKFGATA